MGSWWRRAISGTIMDRQLKIRWWEWLPFFRWRIVGCVEAADEVPDQLPRNSAVLVGTKNYPKWLVFNCPCRSGHRIMLNADMARAPVWRLLDDSRGRLTISPSVNYSEKKRRCHYFVRNGKIQWTNDAVRL